MCVRPQKGHKLHFIPLILLIFICQDALYAHRYANIVVGPRSVNNNNTHIISWSRSLVNSVTDKINLRALFRVARPPRRWKPKRTRIAATLTHMTNGTHAADVYANNVGQFFGNSMRPAPNQFARSPTICYHSLHFVALGAPRKGNATTAERAEKIRLSQRESINIIINYDMGEGRMTDGG